MEDIGARPEATMQRLQPAPAGWAWYATPVDRAPGWHLMVVRGPGPGDRLIGGVTFLGPGEVVLNLSSNPFIHGFSHRVDVLAELGSAGWTADELRAEIERRTRLGRDTRP